MADILCRVGIELSLRPFLLRQQQHDGPRDAASDKHEDAAGLRLWYAYFRSSIGGKGTAWIFTEQAERAHNS